MTRVTNWPAVLAAKVEAWRPRTFSWESWSCCHLADDHIVAMTGRSYLSRFTFSTQEDAERIIAAYGGMVSLITRTLKQEPIAPAWAQRGDLLAVEFGYGIVPAPCLGAVCCTPGFRGLAFRPSSHAIAAWRI